MLNQFKQPLRTSALHAVRQPPLSGQGMHRPAVAIRTQAAAGSAAAPYSPKSQSHGLGGSSYGQRVTQEDGCGYLNGASIVRTGALALPLCAVSRRRNARHCSAAGQRRGAASNEPKETPAAKGEEPAAKEEENEKGQASASEMLGRFKGWWKKNAKIDRKALSRMGVQFVLTYGFISNVNAIGLLLLACYRAIAVTGQSPFGNAVALKQFGLNYAALYLVSNLVRPLRVALAVALHPAVESAVKRIEKTLSCRRAVAIGLLVFVMNVVFSFMFLGFGLKFISFRTGVQLDLARFGEVLQAGKAAKASAA